MLILISVDVRIMFYHGLSDHDNESLYMPSVPTLSGKSAVCMTVDENGDNGLQIN